MFKKKLKNGENINQMPKKEIGIENHTVRVSKKFNSEIGDIIKKRLKIKIDKKKTSFRKITKFIVSHPLWPQMKKELIVDELIIEEKKHNG